MSDTPGKVLSSLTGGNGSDKHNPKLGGCVGVFFQLFDWNRRLTGKRLFANRLLPAERPKQVPKKCADEKLPMAKLLLIADENRGGFPGSRKSSSASLQSCLEEASAGSCSDDGNGSRAPSVVAKLMGLDSMPAPAPELSDFHSKQVNEKALESTRPLPELMQQRRQFEQVNKEQEQESEKERRRTKLNGLLKRSLETRPQKLQKTGFFEKRPVTKFQPDTLPFKSILSPSKSNANTKMLSPIKSPGILSSKNAARLMEAAAKILEPGMQSTNKARNSLAHASVARPPLREAEARKVPSKRHIKAMDPSPVRKTGDSSNSKSQSLSKSWNGKETTGNSKPVSDTRTTSLSSSRDNHVHANATTGATDASKRKPKLSVLPSKQAQAKLGASKSSLVKNQQKTLSLALEAKANVQKRENEIASLNNNQKRENEIALLNNNYEAGTADGLIQGPEKCTDFKKTSKCEEQMAVPSKEPESKPKKSIVPQVTPRAPPKQASSTQGNRTFNTSLASEKIQNKNSRSYGKSNRTLPGEVSKATGKLSESTSERVASNRNLSRNRTSATARNPAVRKDTGKHKEALKMAEEKKVDSYTVNFSPKKKRSSDGHLISENAFADHSRLGAPNCSSFGKEHNADTMSSGDPLSMLKGKTESSGLPNGDNRHKGDLNTRQDYQSWSKSSIDVVSFTFSSPMRSSGTSQASGSCHGRPPSTRHHPEILNSASPAEGDNLNALLEQKLKELTSTGRVDLTVGNSSRDLVSNKTTASLLQDLIRTLNTERSSSGTYTLQHSFADSDSLLNANAGDYSCSECTSLEFTRPLSTGKVLRVGNDSGASSRPSHAYRDPENSESASDTACAEDSDQPSPVSILEASFSNESCNSADSLSVPPDGRLQLLQASIQNSSSMACVRTHQNHDSELCDSASSSTNLQVVESDKIMDAILDISRLHKIDPCSIGLAEQALEPLSLCHDGNDYNDNEGDLEYARDIISNSEVMCEDVGLLSDEDIPDFLVDPNLFDNLDSGNVSTDSKAKNSRPNKKLFFDCVKECLCWRYSSRFKGSYRTWVKGSAALASPEKLARNILHEIERLRSMGFGMLDDIVEKDMSTPSGKWTDFERQVFEIGADIERSVFSSLVEEVIQDFLCF